MPFTKISVPAVGLYEMTVSDISLMVLCFFLGIKGKGIHKYFYPFFGGLLLLTFLSGMTVVVVRSFRMFFLEYLPLVFAIFISYGTLAYLSGKNLKKQMNRIRTLLIISLLLSILPVYYQLLTGSKLGYFFDSWGWRYTFLSQNPNQFGVYFTLYSFLIIQITLKFFEKDLAKLTFALVFFFVPVLFSGSKATTLIFAMNFGLLNFFLFTRLSVIKRSVYAIVIGLIVVFSVNPTIKFVKQQGGQISRALSIFDQVSKVDGLTVGGDSGTSMDDGLVLFLRYPLLGVGLGNKPMHTKRSTEVHNTYIKTLATSGIVGFFGLMIVFAMIPIVTMFSQSKLSYNLVVLLFYGLFALMNIPYMLLRQRWVWFYLAITFVLAFLDKEGNIQKNKFGAFNYFGVKKKKQLKTTTN